MRTMGVTRLFISGPGLHTWTVADSAQVLSAKADDMFLSVWYVHEQNDTTLKKRMSVLVASDYGYFQLDPTFVFIDTVTRHDGTFWHVFYRAPE